MKNTNRQSDSRRRVARRLALRQFTRIFRGLSAEHTFSSGYSLQPRSRVRRRVDQLQLPGGYMRIDLSAFQVSMAEHLLYVCTGCPRRSQASR